MQAGYLPELGRREAEGGLEDGEKRPKERGGGRRSLLVERRQIKLGANTLQSSKKKEEG